MARLPRSLREEGVTRQTTSASTASSLGVSWHPPMVHRSFRIVCPTSPLVSVSSVLHGAIGVEHHSSGCSSGSNRSLQCPHREFHEKKGPCGPFWVQRTATFYCAASGCNCVIRMLA